jgi:hypothetical protein
MSQPSPQPYTALLRRRSWELLSLCRHRRRDDCWRSCFCRFCFFRFCGWCRWCCWCWCWCCWCCFFACCSWCCCWCSLQGRYPDAAACVRRCQSGARLLPSSWRWLPPPPWQCSTTSCWRRQQRRRTCCRRRGLPLLYLHPRPDPRRPTPVRRSPTPRCCCFRRPRRAAELCARSAAIPSR